MVTVSDFSIYMRVKKEFLRDDARYYISCYLAEKMDCKPEDVNDNELQKYDYDYLVERFLRLESPEESFVDTWEYIIDEYMKNEYKER